MLTFLLLNAAAVATAAGAARAAAGGPGRRLVFLTACGYAIVIHTAVLLGGLGGWLVADRVALIVVGTAAIAWAIARRGGSALTVAGEDDGAPFDGALRAVPLASLAALAVWACPHLTDATRLWIWDDYTYHMVYPALWLRDHAIAAVAPAQAFTMQAWYPLSASVISTWFMLPFGAVRADALAWVSLTGVLYAVIVASGFAEALARLGCRRGAWAVPLVLFATSHRIGIMASSFSDADLAHAATLFAAFVFAVPRGQDEAPRDIWIDGVYAALLSGVAIGVKVSAAPYAAIVLAMVALRAAARGGRVWAITRVALIFAAGWSVTCAYWYVRNVVHTGNPVYPAKFLVWPGVTFPHTTLREYGAHYGVARAVRDALAVYLNWPMLHALLALAGLTGVILIRHGRAPRWPPPPPMSAARSRLYFARGAVAITAVMLLLLPSTPYSAGNGMTFAAGFVHWDSMRYVALLPILGWTALGLMIDAGQGAALWRRLAAVAVLVAAVRVSDLSLSAWVLASLAIAVAGGLALRMPYRPRRAKLAGAALLALVVAGLVWWTHPEKAAATARSFHREPLFGGAAAVLDRQPAGTRIALYGDQWTYPAFGDRTHLSPVRLDGDGRVATAPVGDAMTPGPLTVDHYTFRANLRASGVGLVAVVHLPHPGRSPQWPPQAAALESLGGFRLLYRDAAVGLWKVEGL